MHEFVVLFTIKFKGKRQIFPISLICGWKIKLDIIVQKVAINIKSFFKDISLYWNIKMFHSHYSLGKICFK